MKVRFLVTEEYFWQWDSRNDEWIKRTHVEKSLQYLEDDGTWVGVPTVTVRIDPGDRPDA